MGSKHSDSENRLRSYLRKQSSGAGSKLPGERELAQQVGVGRTVLRTMLCSLEREGILERRPQSGTFLVRLPMPELCGSNSNISVIAPFSGTGHDEGGTDANWLYRVVSAFERTASVGGARIRLIDQSMHLENACSVKELACQAAENGAAAVLLIHPVGSFEKISHALAMLHNRNVHPIIVSSRSYPGLASQIYFDSGWGAFLATQKLLSFGHRRIGFAGAPAGHQWVQDRLHGFMNALEAAEIGVNSDWIHIPEQGERLACMQDGKSAWKALWSLPAEIRPTAIVAANDMVALGIIKASELDGVLIPDQLSLIGFDNDPQSLLAGLTTLERPTETLGEVLAQITLDKLSEKPGASSITRRLRPVLIERRSTGSPFESH